MKKITSLLLALVMMTSLLVTGAWADEPKTWAGTITEDSAVTEHAGIYEISTADQLAWVAKQVNDGTNTFAGKTVKLMKDIDLGGKEWMPIGKSINSYPSFSFAGTFDGQDKTIFNLTVNDAGKDAKGSYDPCSAAGLIGTLTGNIKNLKINGARIVGNHYVGTIAGYSSTSTGSEVNNCHVTGAHLSSIPQKISESDYDNGDKVGGIIGYCVSPDKITNCSVTESTVNGYRDVGGICGCADATVTGNAVKSVTITANQVTNFYGAKAFNAGAVIGRKSINVDKSNTADSVAVTYIVNSTDTFNNALADLKDGVTNTIQLAGDISLKNEINPSNVTIDGQQNHTISTDSDSWSGNHMITAGENVTIKNITLVGGENSNGGLQYYCGSGTIENITIKDFEKCGLTINASEVTATGNLKFDNCGWRNILNVGYGENISKEKCSFDFSKANLSGINMVYYDTGDRDRANSAGETIEINPADSWGWHTEYIDGKIDKLGYVPTAVAAIDNAKYSTLADAVEAVKTGDTIKMLADVSDGTGIIVKGGNNFTIDFDNHTYTVKSGPLAGSPGTKTQCFQLLKGSTITMKNGTLTANNTDVKMMVQNYCDLTLENMTLDATQGENTVGYVLSNNCGKVKISGATSIKAKEGNYAFDACWAPNKGYAEGTQISIDTTGFITGNVQLDLWGSDVDTGCLTTLDISNCKLNGEIVVDENMANYSDNISISGGYYTVDPAAYVVEGKIAAQQKNIFEGITYDYIVNSPEAPSGGSYIPSAPVEAEDDDPATEVKTGDHEAYIKGYEDGTVRPEASITRAEVAELFYRQLSDTELAKYADAANKFTDVAADAWYVKSVAVLSAMSVINGRTDTTFDPTANVTRAEFAAMAARMYKLSYTGEDKFSDIADSWAKDLINAVADKGWVEGMDGDKFVPGDLLNRAQAVTMLNRILGRLPETKADLVTEGMPTFSDNVEGAWYYLAIQEAAVAHSYKLKDDGIHESWVEMSK